MASTAPSTLPPYKAAFLTHILTHRILHFGTFTLKSGRVSPYFFNAGLLHRADLLHSLASAYAHTLLAHQPQPVSSPSTSTSTSHPVSTSTSTSHPPQPPPTAALTSPTCALPPPLEFDLLFGPAYKGIPLCIATLLSLLSLSPSTFSSLSYAFNRKEAKSHGEGGSIVGAPLKGQRVVIVDDVITAGTAIREAIAIIEREGGTVVGVVVALDRGERIGEGEGEEGSALGSVRRMLGGNVPVLAVLTLQEVIDGLRSGGNGVGNGEGERGRLGTEEEVRALEAYQARWRAVD